MLQPALVVVESGSGRTDPAFFEKDKNSSYLPQNESSMGVVSSMRSLSASSRLVSMDVTLPANNDSQYCSSTTSCSGFTYILFIPFSFT